MQLWLPGDLVDPDVPLCHWLSHAGGSAVYPGEQAPAQAASILCVVCRAPLALVLQASTLQARTVSACSVLACSTLQALTVRAEALANFV